MTPLPDIAEIILLPALVLASVVVATTMRDLSVHVADRAEPARLDAPVFSLIVREACARGLLAVVQWLPVGDPRPLPLPQAEDHVPVLLVPSLGRGPQTTAFLRIFLRQRGFSWVWSIAHPAGDSLAERAQALGQRVAELQRASGAPQVDLVAHGIGGLIAAWYVSHQDGGDAVRRVVTLGTPWRGTRAAVFWRDAIAAECLYNAPVLDELQNPPLPTTVVWSEGDPCITPPSSALPDGADSVHIDRLGSDEQLLNARAFRAVQFALLRPGPTT